MGFLGKLFGGKAKSTPSDLRVDFPINDWLVETDSAGGEIMYQVGGWELDKVILKRKGTNIQVLLTREEVGRRGIKKVHDAQQV